MAEVTQILIEAYEETVSIIREHTGIALLVAAILAFFVVKYFLSAYRKKHQPQEFLLEPDGKDERRIGILHSRIDASNFGYGPLNRRLPVIVRAYSPNFKQLGRPLRMYVQSKRGSFPDKTVELNALDLHKLGIKALTPDQRGSEDREWPKSIFLIVRNASVHSPQTLWHHPDGNTRLQIRMTLVFTAISFAVEPISNVALWLWNGVFG